MPVDDAASSEDILIETIFSGYDIFFFGGSLNGDVEIRLYNDMNVQVGVVRLLNNIAPLPNDVYENNIIFLHTNIITLDAILHKLETPGQKIIHFDSAIPVATLKFSKTNNI
jgi:hypothetical protein